MPDVRIVVPANGRMMRPSFLVAGRADDESIKSVKGWLSYIDERDRSRRTIDGETVLFVPPPTIDKGATRSVRYRNCWAIAFKGVPARSGYKLHVTGLDEDGDPFGNPADSPTFEVKQPVAPKEGQVGTKSVEPTYPGDQYNLYNSAAEQELFIVEGVLTHPIASATIGNATVGYQNSDYVYDDVEIPYFCAHFSSPPLVRDLKVKVIDSMGHSFELTVHNAAPTP